MLELVQEHGLVGRKQDDSEETSVYLCVCVCLYHPVNCLFPPKQNHTKSVKQGL